MPNFLDFSSASGKDCHVAIPLASCSSTVIVLLLLTTEIDSSVSNSSTASVKSSNGSISAGSQ